MATSLGEKIRELRKKKGYTLDDLAAKSESSKSYIWELENKDPPRALARIYRAAFDTDDLSR